MVTGMVTEEAHVVLLVILLVRRVELLLTTSQLSGVLVVPGPLAVEAAVARSVLDLPWSEEATLQQMGAPNWSSDPMQALGAVQSVDV